MTARFYAIIYTVICASGLAMILYAVYHAYHSPYDTSTDRLFIWLGVPPFVSGLYCLITGRHLD